MNLIHEYCFRDLFSILFLSLLHCPHCHWDKSSLQPACHIYIAGCLPAHHTPPSFTSSLHNVTGLFFLPTVFLSLDLPQFHIRIDDTSTCLSSCSLLYRSSAARLDGRKGNIVQAEPIKKGHTNSVWTLMWLHKPFTSLLCNPKLTLTEAPCDLFSLLWLSILPSLTSKFMIEIFTVLASAALHLWYCWSPLSLPARPFLPPSHASMDFGLPVNLLWLLEGPRYSFTVHSLSFSSSTYKRD